MSTAPPHSASAEAPSDNSPAPQVNSKAPLEDRVAARWLRITQAVTYSGINRSRLFKLIAEGVIKTASLKEHPKATRGIRLVDRYSLDLYLEALCLPLEQKLVAESQALAAQEQELTQQQATLAQKQRELEKELDAVRKRRHGGPVPFASVPQKSKTAISRKK
jgi:hypothetical protein